MNWKEVVALILIVILLLASAILHIIRINECEELGGELIRAPYLYKCAKLEVIK